MKTKTLAALAVAGLVSSVSSFGAHAGGYGQADQLGLTGSSVIGGSMLPPNVSEAPPSMGTINSLDNRTGGYKGWGPMANLATPSAAMESNPSLAYFNEKNTQAQQLAEVRQVRDQVWVANAPMRSEYDNIGATRSHAGGFGSFFSRDKR